MIELLADHELTAPQRAFVARQAIVNVLAEWTPGADTPALLHLLEVVKLDDVQLVDRGVDPDVLAGYRLALEDLEKARTVMEEYAAFAVIYAELEAENPSLARPELRKLARPLVADPARRAQAVAESQVYAKLGFEA